MSMWIPLLVGITTAFVTTLVSDVPAVCGQSPDTDPLRIGMIGLDTSHVPAFAKIFNDPLAEGDLATMRVVAGFPGGTDFPPSRDRVAGFTQQLREAGVTIVDSIPELLAQVDVVLLESVDGRVHLEQALPVILAGKPLFIDKPLAGSLADCVAICELAKQHGVPFFSCSSYRFTPAVVNLKNSPQVGDILGVATWGPCTYQEHTPDLYFYGVHGVEALYTLMGPRMPDGHPDQITRRGPGQRPLGGWPNWQLPRDPDGRFDLWGYRVWESWDRALRASGWVRTVVPGNRQVLSQRRCSA
jgi:hypothetical protein